MHHNLLPLYNKTPRHNNTETPTEVKSFYGIPAKVTYRLLWYS